jgi:aryl-phospho-beta-D-glucosidase BglC (GH1 family)
MKELIKLSGVELKYFLVIFFLLFGCQKEDTPNPVPPYHPIDLDLFSANLRGFNLQGKFDTFWSNNGFREEDFRMISDLGFNFARLPLDYLTYTQWGDWNVFLESEVAEIDQAVEWGKKYGVHICINLHRAPGYSVNVSDQIPANQQLNLWTDAAAQNAFVNHWEYFADRYKDVPTDELSFNLLNEPANVDESTYVSVMQKAIDRIHGINPNRVIFVDGLNYANDLILSLKNVPNVIQAIHAYEPFVLTHYKASWVDGSDTWPVPVWPMIDISSYLFGSWKPEYQSSLIIQGNFSEGAEIIINVKQVSIESTLEIRLDDQVIYTKHFVCGPDLGEDWTEINLTQWGYQNISNKDYSVVFPSDGSSLTISNTEGDWMTYNQITINSTGSDLTIIPGNNSWGSKQDSYLIDSEGNMTDADGNPLILRELQKKLNTAEEENIPVMIQEFGVHNQTPHSVTLAFLSDLVPIFRKFKLGYALWNFEGSFGIINSGRSDCNYETYEGVLLDREMLEILRD